MKRLFLILALLLPAVANAQYRGTVPKGDTLYFLFNTLDSSGEPVAFGGTEGVAVYEEGNATQITTGAAIDDDYDSVTGLHEVSIATTDSAYEAGKWYTVVIQGTSTTADSVSVEGRVIGTFRIVAAENVAGVPTVDIDYVGGTDEATALVEQADITGGAYPLDTDANGRIRVVDGTGTGEIDTSSGTVSLSATTEGQIDAIETDTAAMDTANELRTLLTGGTTALSTLTVADIWNATLSTYSGTANSVAEKVSKIIEVGTKYTYTNSDTGDGQSDPAKDNVTIEVTP